jgi:hypothetical protein
MVVELLPSKHSFQGTIIFGFHILNVILTSIDDYSSCIMKSLIIKYEEERNTIIKS